MTETSHDVRRELAAWGRAARACDLPAAARRETRRRALALLADRSVPDRPALTVPAVRPALAWAAALTVLCGGLLTVVNLHAQQRRAAQRTAQAETAKALRVETALPRRMTALQSRLDRAPRAVPAAATVPAADFGIDVRARRLQTRIEVYAVSLQRELGGLEEGRDAELREKRGESAREASLRAARDMC